MMFANDTGGNSVDGVAVPYGRAGCAGAMALLLGLIGLALPTALTQSIAFQLYLDQLFPAAVPPFGWLSRIVCALVLGAIGAGLGWLLGRVFGVVANGWTLRQLLDHVRGIGRDDDADAPVLRSADRHPDAPARRPFSAATDIPRDTDMPGWSTDSAPVVMDAVDGLIDDDEELLLDYSFADAPPMTPDSALADPPQADPVADAWPMPPVAQTDPVSPQADPVADSPAAVQDDPLPMPPQVAAPVAAADLSHERLDILLARLEAGLARREPQPAPDVAAPAVPAPDMGGTDAVPTPANSPSVALPQGGPPEAVAAPSAAPVPGADAAAEPFASDPALAAALATLRRMHQHVG